MVKLPPNIKDFLSKNGETLKDNDLVALTSHYEFRLVLDSRLQAKIVRTLARDVEILSKN